MGKQWTRSEIETIKSFYEENRDKPTGKGGFDLSILAKQLNRPKTSIVHLAARYGLSIMGRKTAKKTNRWIINKKGCWIWQLALNNKGYAVEGGSSTKGTRLVHIKNYEEKYGKVPDGLELDHIVCDTPRCVNPGHTKPVTHAENIRRGRINTIFSEDRIILILQLVYEERLTSAQVAKKLGLKRTTIVAIVTGQNQKDLRNKWIKEWKQSKLEREEMAKKGLIDE